MRDVNIRVVDALFLIGADRADHGNAGVGLDLFRNLVAVKLHAPGRAAGGFVIAEHIVVILVGRFVIGLLIRAGHADGFAKTLQVQPLIANIDYVFIITSLNRDFSVSRIARYAAMTVSGGAVPVAVLTKADLCPNVEELEAEAASLSENLQVVPISSRTGYGLDRLRTYFRPGATIALLGSSGAGKSTLINTLAGREIMQTGGIREEDSKGRHTTTHRELIELDGVSLIDTPGLRELGMIDAEEGIACTFADIAELVRQCAFSDCTHRNEPGCAVREALENGTLSAERWKMFSRLEKENQWSKVRKNEKMMNIAMERRKRNTALQRYGRGMDRG